MCGAQPTDRGCPAAVEMELKTAYELKMPEDSVASTATAGLLGETYLDIDASHASGPPAHSDEQLPSKESVKVTVETLDRALKVVQLLKQLSDEEKVGKAVPTYTTPTTRKK
jgi:ABC-type transporter Mla subunit MlaD